MHAYRTHTCGALRRADVGQKVRISGWIHRKRDHGGLLFVDLRDHYGITQCVALAGSESLARLERLRSESVITIDGEVVARSAGTVNADLPTGEIELKVIDVTVQSEAAELPVPVFGEPDYPEDLRLKYRFLDLRRESLHASIILRSAVIASLRRRMIEQGFMEFQTPILTASSPEGARDFLVPSRMHPGKFYALPQAPQQFKQLLMVAGFDRYFQIAPCFRDEDARADRSPGEFYQLDFEMSFVTQEDVFAAIEPVLHGVFKEFGGGKRVSDYPFQRIPYAESIAKYGSDKPDLRNPLVMQDVTEHFRGGGFGLFAGMIEKDPKVRVWAIPAPTGGNRAFCDRMNAWAISEGQKGLGYVFWRAMGDNTEAEAVVAFAKERLRALEQISDRPENETIRKQLIDELTNAVSVLKTDFPETPNPLLKGLEAIIAGAFAKKLNYEITPEMARFPVGVGPIAKNLGFMSTNALRDQMGLGVGDAVFFVAGDPDSFYKFAGLARNKVGFDLKLVDEDQFRFCWVVDFPMYEWNEDEKKIDFSHNPFSMPNFDHEAFLKLDANDRDTILGMTAFQYDIVCNGVELSSGAIRNHKPEIMLKAFEIAGYGPDVVEAKFGGMLNAFRFGAPPHGGSAPGVDRIVMLLAGKSNIREIIAFPLNQQAQDVMMQAPSTVTPKQLRELHIRIVD